MQRNLGILFVLITVVIDSMGIGLIIPVMPDLVQSLLGQGLAHAAIWGGILATVFAVMQFLFSPLVGNLSDRFGRKPILLISLFVVGVDYVIMGFTHSIWVLLLGRVIAGIGAATASTANAYMADVSSADKRAQNFGLVGAAFGVGFVLGPMVGGVLAEFGPRAPFFAAAILFFANFVFGYFAFKESLPLEKRRPIDRKRLNPLGAFSSVNRSPVVMVLLIIFAIHQLGFFAYATVWSYFLIERFAWTPFTIGISLGVFGLCLAAVQGGLIRVIVPRTGEWCAAKIGLAFSIFGAICVGLAPLGWMIFVIIPLMSLSFITVPSLQAILSKLTPEDSQGELQGVWTSVSSVASIFGPLLMTACFFYFTNTPDQHYMPGAPFLLAAALDVLALGALYVFWARSRVGLAAAN